MTVTEMAAVAANAYYKSSFAGGNVDWHVLDANIRTNWIAAAQAVHEAMEKEKNVQANMLAALKEIQKDAFEGREFSRHCRKIDGMAYKAIRKAEGTWDED